MANDEHLALLKRGVKGWNEWRNENDSIRINLRGADLRGAILREAILSTANLSTAHLNGADLRGADLFGADLREADLIKANLFGADLRTAHLNGADLREANLSEANLRGANLRGAILRGAYLRGADLFGADLREADLIKANLFGADLRTAHLNGADLREANLSEANLSKANLRGADLRGADLRGADLFGADLREADLSKANLFGADLIKADLRGADLTGAILTGAQLIETDLTNANLTGCHIYGVSAWNLTLEGVQQRDLIITSDDEPEITVDNLEVAQFIHLLLHNEKIRNVIDTLGKKAVLILGRFTPERKPGLDAIRDALRNYNYLPVMFDFQKPESQDFIQPVSTLAHLSRFIIADVTDPKIVLEELPHIVRNIPIPVIPLLLEGSLPEPSTLLNLRVNHLSVLPTYWYQSPESLLASLKEKVIDPAEAKVEELLERKIKLLSSR